MTELDYILLNLLDFFFLNTFMLVYVLTLFLFIVSININQHFVPHCASFYEYNYLSILVRVSLDTKNRPISATLSNSPATQTPLTQPGSLYRPKLQNSPSNGRCTVSVCSSSISIPFALFMIFSLSPTTHQWVGCCSTWSARFLHIDFVY